LGQGDPTAHGVHFWHCVHFWQRVHLEQGATDDAVVAQGLAAVAALAGVGVWIMKTTSTMRAPRPRTIHARTRFAVVTMEAVLAGMTFPAFGW
jgi:hypothetical protein